MYVLELGWIVAAVLFGELFCWKCKLKRMFCFYSIKIAKVGVRLDRCILN